MVFDFRELLYGFLSIGLGWGGIFESDFWRDYPYPGELFVLLYFRRAGLILFGFVDKLALALIDHRNREVRKFDVLVVKYGVIKFIFL